MATIEKLTAAYVAVNDGRQPSAETLAQLQTFANLSTNGPLSDAQALSYILNGADKTTSLALLSYQFFTGKAPTQAGLDYLTNSPTNGNDLNDAYYAQFGLENRYINFSANLGVQGEGAAAFATKYGAMSFSAYVASIYETIIGGAYATAAGIDPAKAIADIVSRQAAILATAQASGMITAGMTQAQIDIALKAATAGYLLGEAIKADVGVYASAANNFMVALVEGKASYNTDLTTTYAAAPGQGGAGQAVAPSFTFTPPAPPPPPAPPEPDPDPAVSHAFVLTTAADAFTGESLDDTFTGAVTLNGSTLDPASTYAPTADRLDGAGGYDTLSLTIGGASAPQLTIDPTKISGVERLSVKANVVATTVNLAGTRFTELVSDQSATGLTFAGYGASVTKIGVNGLTGTGFFTPDGATLTGAADALTVTLADVGTSSGSATVTLTANGGSVTDWYETLNIVSSGAANYVQLKTGNSHTGLGRVNISGAAPLNLFTASNDKLFAAPIIDASAATGGVTIGSSSFTLQAANQTVTLGTGANVVFFGANLDGADTVDASRGGDDTLVVSGALTSAAVAHVTGVETFRFMPTATFTQDVSQLPAGVTGVQILATTLLTATFDHMANGMSVGLTGSNPNVTLGLALADGSGASDTLTLRFGSLVSGTTALKALNDVAGLETLNIVSGGSATLNRITSDLVTAAHVVTGAVNLTLTNALATARLDASAFTGNLTATAAATGTVFIGGTGNDSLTGGAGNDRFQLGAQGHNAPSGVDTIITNGGSDTLAFVGNGANTGALTSYAGLTTIRGTSAANSVVSNLTLSFSADDHDFSLKNADGTVFTGLAKGAVAQGLAAGSTIVAQSVAQDVGAGVLAANTVSMFSLSSGVAFTTDLKTLFATAMGDSSITGLAADANYLILVHDDTNGMTLIGVVNTGASHAGDTTLSAADFTDTGVALIGAISTTTTTNGLSLGPAF